MKKLYGGRPSTVHPDEQVPFVPAAILTLAASLSPDDREVLAYLLLSSELSTKTPNTTATATAVLHPLSFTCTCFRCYMTYWVRWDASPNRQLIHQIIDAFEHHQHKFNNTTNKTPKKKKKKDKRPFNTTAAAAAKNPDVEEMNQLLLLMEETSFHHVVDDGIEKPSTSTSTSSSSSSSLSSSSSSSSSPSSSSSSVRKLVSFIGERIWNLWIE